MSDPLSTLRPDAAAASPPSSLSPQREAEIMQAARAFEAVFVAQMLSYSGLAKSIGSNAGFGGEAFSALMVEQYAEKIVEKGGFGLTESIYQQLRAKEL